MDMISWSVSAAAQGCWCFPFRVSLPLSLPRLIAGQGDKCRLVDGLRCLVFFSSPPLLFYGNDSVASRRQKFKKVKEDEK